MVALVDHHGHLGRHQQRRQEEREDDALAGELEERERVGGEHAGDDHADRHDHRHDDAVDHQPPEIAHRSTPSRSVSSVRSTGSSDRGWSSASGPRFKACINIA